MRLVYTEYVNVMFFLSLISTPAMAKTPLTVLYSFIKPRIMCSFRVVGGRGGVNLEIGVQDTMHNVPINIC